MLMVAKLKKANSIRWLGVKMWHCRPKQLLLVVAVLLLKVAPESWMHFLLACRVCSPDMTSSPTLLYFTVGRVDAAKQQSPCTVVGTQVGSGFPSCARTPEAFAVCWREVKCPRQPLLCALLLLLSLVHVFSFLWLFEERQEKRQLDGH